jgi:pimeloyl-ACP methyl ester carboxylesterase
LFLGGLYAALVASVKAFETTLVHSPRGGPESWEPKPTDRIEDVTFSADGRTVHAWWLPPPSPERPVVLYCHGKGGNLSNRGRVMTELQHRLGCGVLQFDYPGYGKSDGFPTEPACYAAADAALDWLQAADIPADRVVLLGESLGGGVAVELASRRDCRAVVLVCTYTTLPAAAATRFWFLPCDALMSNRFDSVAKLKRVKCPVLVAHGTADDRIPFAQGEALFAAANEPKRFVRLDGCGHGGWNCLAFFTAAREFVR